MKKVLLPVFVFLATLCSTGCNGQVPSSLPNQAQLTWTQSTSCTTATPCSSFVISRASVATASTPCPATNATNYTQVGTAGQNATTFTDSTLATVGAGYFCWIVQAQQGSGSNILTSAPSASSNNGVALQVSQPPLAPVSPTVASQVAKNNAPELAPTPSPELAQNIVPMQLSVRMIRAF